MIRQFSYRLKSLFFVLILKLKLKLKHLYYYSVSHLFTITDTQKLLGNLANPFHLKLINNLIYRIFTLGLSLESQNL